MRNGAGRECRRMVERGAVDLPVRAWGSSLHTAITRSASTLVYRIRKKSGDTDPADGVILREAPRKALRPRESLAPTEESLRWAHHPVGYDRLWREKPRPFPIKILRSAHRLPRGADGSGWAPPVRMTVIVHNHCFCGFGIIPQLEVLTQKKQGKAGFSGPSRISLHAAHHRKRWRAHHTRHRVPHVGRGGAHHASLGTSGTADGWKRGRGPSAFFQAPHCRQQRPAACHPASPDARSREPSLRATAAGTRWTSRVPRIRKIAHQVFVKAGSGALPAGLFAGGCWG
jgi:hypothetical protein